jgi:Lon protease-like protein
MDFELELPSLIPAMTLRDTVLFPQIVLPLYIFEPRYRAMLQDVLEGDRLFAIVREADTEESAENHTPEPPSMYATVGIIRGAHKNADGTSNLVLQGVARVRVEGVETEEPYRVIRIAPVEDDLSPDSETLQACQTALRRRVEGEGVGKDDLPQEFLDFMHSIDDPALYVDYLAYAVCSCPSTKQRILGTPTVRERYQILESYLDRCAQRNALFQKLQGKTEDDRISLN